MSCLDLTYLMEQRLRYTHIRDELEMSHLLSEFRRKCERCLMISDGEESDDSESTKSEAEEGEEEEDISKSEKKDGSKSETVDVCHGKKYHQKHGKRSKMIDSKKPDPDKSSKQQKKKKPKKMLSNIMDEDEKVLQRFWFKRDRSPPPQNELEQHLYELRMRTRKEMHTLLFLNCAAKEGKIKKLKMYTALLNGKLQQRWNKHIEMLEKEFEILPEGPADYNNNNLLERLEENPELIEAINKFKTEQPLRETIMEHSYEIATRMERQFFSLIPGVTGLTTYRNAMICELARDETITITI
ncbi:unnamed protein product [Cercopithifilaria johnstoni]|uniref:Uncharacterized protein n=1 Tax=Cercopithifilaria johnstoni TaxID=2874296 RepID=A0A8J2Q6F3_9BILA|nr:unnamed protein product [Cercopithifilaria johnstoni]